jgi:hypothetical protein
MGLLGLGTLCLGAVYAARRARGRKRRVAYRKRRFYGHFLRLERRLGPVYGAAGKSGVNAVLGEKEAQQMDTKRKAIERTKRWRKDRRRVEIWLSEDEYRQFVEIAIRHFDETPRGYLRRVVQAIIKRDMKNFRLFI